MKRRHRYKFIKRWRAFRDKCNKIDSEGELRRFIINNDNVKSFSIIGTWEKWVTVTIDNGREFCYREFWPVDSLKKIANDMYSYFIKTL